MKEIENISQTKRAECPNGRCVGRSNNNANANGGLSYSNANNASSNSNANDGCRLTTKCSSGKAFPGAHRHPATGLVKATAGGEGQEPRQKHSTGVESGNMTEAPEGALLDVPFMEDNFEPIAEGITYPVSNLIQEIISDENMSESFDYVINHLEHKSQREKYRQKKERYIRVAKKRIGDGSYRIRREGIKEIEVDDGNKRRRVQVTTVFDRFCCHSVMVVVEAYCYPSLITNAAASVKNRGTHWLHARIEQDINAVPDMCASYCQTDGTKFYDNIDQEIMKDVLRQYISDFLLLPILFDFVTLLEKGLSKGLRSSQVFANLYMTRIDYIMTMEAEKYVLEHDDGTEELRVLYYRYMDDAYWFGPDHKTCWRLFSIYNAECAKQHVIVKHNYAVRPLSEGFDALGYEMFPTAPGVGKKTGKWCYSRVRKRIKVKFARRMARVKSRSRRQKLIAAFNGVANHADARHLQRILIPKKYMATLSELGLPAYVPKDGKKRFSCQQKRFGEIVNRPIIVLDFETGVKTQNGLRTLVLFHFEGETTEYKFFTASEEMTFNLQAMKDRNMFPTPPLTIIQVSGTGGLSIYKFK